jgi:hypothetical protein
LASRACLPPPAPATPQVDLGGRCSAAQGQQVFATSACTKHDKVMSGCWLKAVPSKWRALLCDRGPARAPERKGEAGSQTLLCSHRHAHHPGGFHREGLQHQAPKQPTATSSCREHTAKALRGRQGLDLWGIAVVSHFWMAMAQPEAKECGSRIEEAHEHSLSQTGLYVRSVLNNICLVSSQTGYLCVCVRSHRGTWILEQDGGAEKGQFMFLDYALPFVFLEDVGRRWKTSWKMCTPPARSLGRC